MHGTRTKALRSRSPRRTIAIAFGLAAATFFLSGHIIVEPWERTAFVAALLPALLSLGLAVRNFHGASRNGWLASTILWAIAAILLLLRHPQPFAALAIGICIGEAGVGRCWAAVTARTSPGLVFAAGVVAIGVGAILPILAMIVPNAWKAAPVLVAIVDFCLLWSGFGPSPPTRGHLALLPASVDSPRAVVRLRR